MNLPTRQFAFRKLSRAVRPSPHELRTGVEPLEQRIAPATFLVTNVADIGAGSLRQAILDANGATGADDISFNIPGAGPHVIQPRSALPAISTPIVIDGYTEPGSSPNTLAVGSNAVLSIVLDGTMASSANGLNITGSGSTVRGLAIHSFQDPSGTANSGYGISITGNNNLIEGNFIGTDQTGATDLGNRRDGVIVPGFGSPTGNVIGGASPATRNIILGNGEDGVALSGSTGSANTVQGNYIGTDRTGTLDRGNTLAGVRTEIFATATIRSNVISGNDTGGVILVTSGNIVAGNFLGANASGGALGNGGAGVAVVAGGNNTIGGTTPADANTIAFNSGEGVFIARAVTAPSTIRGNSIHSNAGLGIDLEGGQENTFGVTTNDFGDADTGANGLQNYPVIESAALIDGNASIAGRFNSTPGTTFVLDFFASAGEDPSGFGEGQIFLGSATVTTDSAGDTSFNITPAVAPTNRAIITATATRGGPVGATSEFSNGLAVLDLLEVTSAADDTNFDSIVTLREAITSANQLPGVNTITFNIPGAAGGVRTINVGSTGLGALPAITDTVVIDGYSQPGASANTLPTSSNAVPLIELNGLGAGAGADGLRLRSDGSQVRGLVINRFAGDAIDVASGANNIIAGNFIGTNPDGTTLPASVNGQSGIVVVGADGTRIEGNLISGNAGRGIVMGPFSDDGAITGNLIGVAKDGTSALGNALGGVRIFGSNNTRVGGTLPGEANVIANNDGAGVVVIREPDSGAGSGNTIRGNAIFGNTGLGIDLGGNGVTLNDLGDADTGANGLQNFPVLTSATRGATTVNVSGTLNSTANTAFVIDFYTNSAADPSGSGEGQAFLGTINATTNASGDIGFSFNFPTAIPAGSFITATATNPAGNTSEFSSARPATSVFTWDGSDSSDWFDADNWTPMGVPGAADTAILDNTAASRTIVLNQPFTVANFEMRATGGELQGNQTLTTLQSFVWTEGTLLFNARVNAPAGSNVAISGGDAKQLGAGLRGSGFLDIGGTASITGAGFSIVNGSAATITGTASVDAAGISGAPDSFLRIEPGGTLTKTAASVTQISVPYQNMGTTSITAGTLQLAGGGSSPGLSTWNISTGASLVVSGGFHNYTGAASFTGGGSLVVSGGNFSLGGGAGTLGLSNVTLNGGGLGLGSLGSVTTLPAPGTFNFVSGDLTGSGGLVVDGSATLTAGRLVSGGTLIMSASSVLTVNNTVPIIIGAFQIGDGFLNILGTATVTGTGGFNFNNGGRFHVGGTLDLQSDVTFSTFGSGTFAVNSGGTLRKSAGATTTFSVPYENSGTTNITAGTLQLTGGGSSPGVSAWNISTGASLVVSGGFHNYTGAASFTGGGSLVVSGGNFSLGGGAGTLGLSNVTLNGGGLGLGSLGSVTTLPAPGTFNFVSGDLTGSGGLVVDGSATLTAGRLVSGGTLIMSASSVLTVNNTVPIIIGAFQIGDGFLNILGTATVTGTGGFNFNNGGRFHVGGTLDLQSDVTFSTFGSGTFAVNSGGTLRKSAGATTTFSVPYENSGTTNITAGTLQLTGGGSSPGLSTWNISTGASLVVSGGFHNYTGAASFTGGGSLVVSGGNFSLGGGAGTLGLSNVTLNGGGLGLGSLGSVTTLPAPGTFNFVSGDLTGAGGLVVDGSATLTAGRLVFGGTLITSASSVLTANNSSPIIIGAGITGDGFLNILGTATVTGAGGFNINNGGRFHVGGTLDLQSDASFSTFGGGTFAVNSGGTLRKSAGATTTFTLPVSNAGTIEAQSGTLAFDNGFTQTAGSTALSGGAFSSTGTFIFNGGELRGAGTITGSVNNSGATVRPGGTGAAGTLAVTGAYMQGAGGTLAVELGGTGAGQFDVLNVSGNATVDGTLNIAHLGGFTPVSGNSFRVVQSANNPTTFTTLTGQTAGKAQTADATGLLITQNALVYIWDNSAGNGDWFNALNWDRDSGVPGGSDTAILNIVSTINLPSSTSVGTFQQSNGTFTSPSGVTFTVLNSFDWSGGTMAGGGTAQTLLAAGSVSTFSGAGLKRSVDRAINLAGSVTWTGTGALALDDATLTIQSGGLLDMQNDAVIGDSNGTGSTGRPPGSLVIAGTLRKSASSGTTTIGSTLAPAGDGRVITTLNAGGRIEVQSGVLNFLDATASSAGEFAVSNGARLDVSNLFTLNSGATITGAGSVRINGQLNVAGAASVAGTLELVASGTLSGGAALTVNGNFNWSGGTMSGAGATILAAGSVSMFSGASVKRSIDRPITLAGTATWTGTGALALDDATLTIQNGGLFDIQNDAVLGDSNGTGSTGRPAGKLIVEGLLRKSAGSGVTNIGGTVAPAGDGRVNTTLNATGRVEVESGTLNFSDGAVTAAGGTFNVASTAALTFNVAPSLGDGTAFSGTGAARLLAGASLAGGTVTTTNLEWAGGGLSGTGAISGNWSWSGGTSTATVTHAAGGTLAILGGNRKTINTGLLTIAGTAIWSGAGELAVDEATLIIATGGLFDIQTDAVLGDSNGTGSTGRPPGTLIVEGTLRKSAGSGVTMIGSTLAPAGDGRVNTTINPTGRLEVQSGTLSFVDGQLNNAGVANALTNTLLAGGGGTSSGTFTASLGGNIRFVGGTQTLTDGAAFTGVGISEIAGGRVNAAGNASAANFALSSGTLGGAGVFTVFQTFAWTGGNMDGAGATVLAASSVSSFSGAGLKRSVDRAINLAGSVTWTGTGALALDDATLTIQSGGLLDMQNDAVIGDSNGTGSTGRPPGSLVIAGTLRKSASSGATTIGSTLAPAGDGRVITTLNAGGRIEVQSGVLNFLDATASSAGEFAVSNGARLDVSNLFTLNSGATITGAGSVRINGQLNVAGAASVAGTLELVASGTLSGGAALTVNGNFNWSGGTMSGAGATILAAGSVSMFSGASVKRSIDRPITLAGTATWTGTGALALDDATLTIQNGGLFDIQNDAVLGDSNGTGSTGRPAGKLIVEGLLRKSAGSGVTNIGGTVAPAGDGRVNTTLNATGRVEVESGTLNFSDGAVTAAGGTFNVASTAALTFNVAPSLGDGTAFSGTGAARLLAGASLAGGTVTTTNLEWAGGSLSGTGAISGNWSWSGGTSTATVTHAAGGTLAILGGNRKTINTGLFSIAGTAIWSGAGELALDDATLTIATGGLFDIQNDAVLGDSNGTGSTGRPPGTLIVEGTLRKSAGSGVTMIGSTLAPAGDGRVNTTINPTGRLEVQSGTLSFVDGTFTNAGNIKAQAGNLTFANFTQTGGATELAGGAIGGGSTLAFQGGELRGVGAITGTVSNTGATVRPGGTGAAGTIAIIGSYTHSAGGTLAVELGGTGAGQFDRLTVTGNATLDGTLDIAHLAGFTPASGNSFRVVQSANNPTTFTTLTGQTAGKSQTADATGLVLAQAPVVTTFIWDAGGGADQSWFNPLNWNLDSGVPGAGDTAVLNTNATINLPSNTSVGTFQQSTGTFTSPAGVVFTVLTSFDWTGGTQSGAGSTISDGTLTVSGAGAKTLTTRMLISNGTANLSGGDVNANNAAFTNNGVLNATGNAGVPGTGSASFTNSATGTLNKSGAGTTSTFTAFTNAGTVNAAGGTLNFPNGFTQTAGSTVLSGGNITGAFAFNFQGGELRGTGSIGTNATLVNSGAIVRPGGTGAAGTLTIEAFYEHRAGGRLALEVGGTGAGQFDVLAVTGNAFLTGSAQVSFLGGFTPGSSDTFRVLTAGSRNGQFQFVNGTLVAQYNPTNVTLVAATPGQFVWDAGAGADTNWFNPVNWSPDGVPGATDTATLRINATTTLPANHSVGTLIHDIGGFGGDNPIFTISAGATLTVLTNFTWRGGTEDGAGTLTVAPGASFNLVSSAQPITLSQRTLNLQGTAVSADPSQAPLVLSNGAVINNSGVLDFQGSLNISGTGTINNLAGGILKHSSTNTALIVGNNVAFTNAGTVRAETGTLGFNGGYTQTAGSSQMVGGTLNLFPSFQLQGGELAGVGAFSGTINNTGGIVRPGGAGAIGRLTTNGSYFQAAGGTLELEVGGAGAGQFDVFAPGGNAFPNGTLNAPLLGGFTPASGSQFRVLDPDGSVVGTFATVNSPLTAQYNVGDVTLLGPVGPLTFIWDGGAGADQSWFNPINWNRDSGVPGAADTAILSIASTIDLPSNVQVGTFTQSAGLLMGSGDFTVLSSFTWTGGQQDGGGDTIIPAGGQFALGGSAEKILQREFMNSGNAVWTDSGRLTLIGHTFLNTATGVFEMRNDASIVNSNSNGFSRFENAGLVRKVASPGTTSFSFVDVVNRGTISIESGLLASNFGLTQTAGVLALAGGNLDVTSFLPSVRLDLQGGVLTGAGTIAGNVNNGGAIVRPGGASAAGTISISGDYTQGTGGTLAVELGGTGVGQFDRLTITGGANLNGTLNVTTLGGFTPAAGNTFTVLSSGGRTGTFQTINAPPNISSSFTATDFVLNAAGPTAPLNITVSDTPDPVVEGSNFTYTFTITNDGTQAVTGVSFFDSLPALASLVSATASQGTVSSSDSGDFTSVTGTLGTLAAGASATVTLVVTPLNDGSIFNSAFVTGTLPGGTFVDDTVDETTTVTATGLELETVSVPEFGRTGENVVYQFLVRNDGPNAADSVRFTNPLPAGATFITSSNSQGTGSFSNGTFMVELGSLAPGASAMVSLTVRAAEAVRLNNTASVTSASPDGNAADNTISSTTFVLPPGDLVVTDLGTRPADALVAAIVGQGVAFSNVRYAGNSTSSGTFTGGDGIIGFNSGIVLTSGAAQNVVGPNRQDGISQGNELPGDADLDTLTLDETNDATVLEFDFVPESNVISFQYVFSSDEYNEFANSSFNDVFGFFLNGTNVALLPGTTTAVSINAVNGGNPFGMGAQNPQFFINNDREDGGGLINTEMDGMTVVFSVQATVTPGQVNHIKLAIADTADEDLDSAVFIRGGSFDDVTPQADLAVTLADAPDPVTPGGTLTYVAQVTNSGPTTATSVNLTDFLPANVTFVSATPSQGTSSVEGNFVLVNFGALNAGAMAEVTIVVTANGAGTITNSVSVSSPVLDTITDNNSATASTLLSGGNQLIVTNTNDAGMGSLRQAILDSNALPGLQVISFSIDSTGVQTITPRSALPVVSDPLVIDGYTQPGASANTLAIGNDAVLPIVLAGTPALGNGLTIGASGVTVRGLVIQGFNDGIFVTGANAVITGNWIGVSASGTNAAGNADDGIQVNANGALIGGTAPAERNIISGSGHRGIELTGGFGSMTVQGNYIGTNAAGTAAIVNGENGIRAGTNNVNSPNVVIGGTAPGAGNLISGNGTVPGTGAGGIHLQDSSNALVLGNLIGTNATGTLAIPNIDGVIFNNLVNSRLGGSTAAERNVISGNVTNVSVFFSQNSTLSGNYIGLGADGLTIIGGGTGVDLFSSSGTIIGGTAVGAGNVISGHASQGISMSGSSSGNRVEGNFIGTDASGALDRGNAGAGVGVFGSANNIIGGAAPGARNVISGNDQGGILVSGAGTVIRGNFIGTNATGTAALGNAVAGISLSGANAVIGGAATGEGNVISGNIGTGILLSNGATNATFQGNFIGTNLAGNAALGNTFDGVLLLEGADGNLIGGTTAGARNIISGNGARGVLIYGNSNLVQGNFIGTDVAGMSAVKNNFDGLTIAAPGSNNIIGGATAGARNVISGNDIAGITIEVISGTPAPATGNRVQGNFIGVAADGVTPLGNTAGSQLGWGIALIRNVDNNLIGGSAPGEGNLIAFNDGPGVSVLDSAPTGNRISGNSIFSNGQLGIDLGTDGPTPNDAGDADTGPNGLLNFPTLTSATRSGSLTTISGFYQGAPNATFIIELFANPVGDPSGFGEGRNFLGTATVTTDGSGNGNFTFSTASLTGGTFFSATASDAANNTSEFAQTLELNAGLVLARISDAVTVEGQNGVKRAVFTVRLSEAATEAVRVQFATHDLTTNEVALAGLATAGTDYIARTGEVVFAPGEVEQTFIVNVNGDRVPEQRERFGVSLTDATGAALGVNREGVGVIQDDDHRLFFTGQERGSKVEVRVAGDGHQVFEFSAFAPKFRGGVRIASGDVNGDGVNDIIAGAGSGGGARVRVFDGAEAADGNRVLLFPDIFAYGNAYRGGVFVASGDVDGDGRADIIVAPSAGSSGNVRVLSGLDGSVLSSFTAFGRGSGGVRVATGDVNGDGRADIIAGSGTGRSVKVFDGLGIASITDGSAPVPGSGVVLRELRAFGNLPDYRAGVHVTSGDVDGDGLDDVIVGSAGGTNRVQLFFNDVIESIATIRPPVAEPSRGLRVGVVDANADGIADIIASQGGGGPGIVRIYRGQNAERGIANDIVTVRAFAPDQGGVFVA